MCRSKSDVRSSSSSSSENRNTMSKNRSMKENKVTQTLIQNDDACTVDGLECIVIPPTKLHRINVSKRGETIFK